jgi:hypothetical protein
MQTSRVKVNPTQARVVLSGAVEAFGHVGIQLLWSSPDLSLTGLQGVLLSPSLTGTSLTIRPNLPSGSYMFTLSAAVDDTASSASVTLVVNGVPRNGFVSVTPATGVAIDTKFTMSTAEWIDDLEVGHALHRQAILAFDLL